MPMTKMEVGMTNEIFKSNFEVVDEDADQEEQSNDNPPKQYLPLGSNSIQSNVTRGFSNQF